MALWETKKEDKFEVFHVKIVGLLADFEVSRVRCPAIHFDNELQFCHRCIYSIPFCNEAVLIRVTNTTIRVYKSVKCIRKLQEGKH